MNDDERWNPDDTPLKVSIANGCLIMIFGLMVILWLVMVQLTGGW